MNEAETRAEHIDPALAGAGWGIVDGSRVRREYPITLGRIEGHGWRGKALKADYVLEYRNTRLATGTGKTFVAFQIAWKLCHARWSRAIDNGKLTIDNEAHSQLSIVNFPLRRPRILFLADRNIPGQSGIQRLLRIPRRFHGAHRAG
jgi:hypothetical protein